MGVPLREKELFNVRKKVPMATKPRGGGVKAGPLKKKNFFLRLP